MKDQLTLWLLLCKLKEYGFKTRRLKLQKLIYLADVFGTILMKKPTAYTFRVYKHGPFSKEIYLDIERLVSLDLVKAKQMGIWEPNEDRSFEYEIEETVVSKADVLLRRHGFDIIKKSVEIAVQAAGYLNATEIQRLVYSEPNFVEAKKNGFGSTIDPSYAFAVEFREMSRTMSLEEFGLDLNEEEVLWLYFNFMKTLQTKENCGIA
jgi:hypothetical protein